MQFTSASAGKMIKSLEEEKDRIKNMESMTSTYVLSVGEETEPPEYDFRKTRDAIEEIDGKVVRIRHALHRFNLETVLPNVGITIDEALVAMAQLSEEKRRLSVMRARIPRMRIESAGLSKKGSSVAEYRYANYDISEADRAYQRVAKKIEDIQLDLDRINQTQLFEVDL